MPALAVSQTLPRSEPPIHLEEPGERFRQRNLVVNHLMKTALGEPQVHRRLRASQEFQAALAALDPERPAYVEDENLRNVIKLGCLHMIDTTAALIKFARENNIKIAI